MIYPFLFFLILFFQSPAFAESVDTKMREGISQYYEGEFKEAADNFSFAHTDRPEDSRISYNLGNARYRDGKFQEAMQAYSQSALDENNPTIRKKSLYNTGNTMVKLGKLEEAESAYKKVLELDPGDMDAKYNLEYVRKQQEQKKEQESGKDKQEGEDNPSENEKGEDQDQSNEGDQQSENQPPPPNNENLENEGQNKPSQSQQLGEISKEKAEQMLEGLSEDLKDISRVQAGKTKSNYQGNDW